MNHKRVRRALTLFGVFVVSLIAHVSLQASPAGALDCVYVERSSPYVYVEVCPPI